MAGDLGGKKSNLKVIGFKYLNLSKLGKVSKINKMDGFIHPGWLAGVSRGPKSNQKNIVLKKNTKMIRMV